eukprot:m.159079 g.159079  ORF g.159079 m.159079 type:complete len:920 (-) comp16481_c0_seq1:184-2943(-)
MASDPNMVVVDVDGNLQLADDVLVNDLASEVSDEEDLEPLDAPSVANDDEEEDLEPLNGSESNGSVKPSRPSYFSVAGEPSPDAAAEEDVVQAEPHETHAQETALASETYMANYKQSPLYKEEQEERKEARDAFTKPMATRKQQAKADKENRDVQPKEDKYTTLMRKAAESIRRANSGRRPSAVTGIDKKDYDAYCPSYLHLTMEGKRCLHWPKSLADMVKTAPDEESKIAIAKRAATEQKKVFREPKGKGHTQGSIFDEQKMAKSRLGAAERAEQARQERRRRYRTGQIHDPQGRLIAMTRMQRAKNNLAVWWDRVDDSIIGFFQIFLPFTSLIRRVESRFGSVLTQYFELVRWVMLHNVLLSIFWLGLIIVPQKLEGVPSSRMPLGPEDFFTGSGSFLNTSLYMGSYSNTSFTYGFFEWDMPLAYILTTISTLLLSGLLIFRHMNSKQAASTERVQEYPYANTVFAYWDYNIADLEGRKNRRDGANTVLRDLLEDDEDAEKRDELTFCGWTWLYTKRFSITLFLLGLTGGFAYGLLVLANTYQDSTQFWEQLATPLTASAGLSVLPVGFFFLGAKEGYDKAFSIKLLVLRSYLIRIVAIYTIISAAFRNSNSKTLSDGTISECWEMNVAQELYNLALVNALFTAISTLVGDLGRYIINESVISTVATHGCQPDEVSEVTGLKRKASMMEKIQGLTGKPTFQMGKSTMDLLYNQAMVWLGMYFSPWAAVIGIVTTFSIFGVKVMSLMTMLVPFDTRYRQARDDTFTLFLLLITLLGTASIVGYVMLYFEPSTTCSPFQGQATAWQTIEDHLGNAPPAVSTLLDFVTQPTFIVPLILFILLLSYHKVNMLSHTQAVGRDLKQKYDDMLEQKRRINKLRKQKRKEAKRKAQARAVKLEMNAARLAAPHESLRRRGIEPDE